MTTEKFVFTEKFKSGVVACMTGNVCTKRLSGQTSGSARRRARERRQAELTRVEGERLARERRERRLIEKFELQRQAQEELATYEPWGRAGGGAPNSRGVRYTKLRAGEIYPEDELRGVTQYEVCRHWQSPHRRRRRTPLRLREDPEVCYAENHRKSVDNDIRYRQTPEQQKNYKEILDDLVSKRNRELRDQRKQDLEHERKMQTLAGPWGRPGPGGATWRNPRDIGLNFAKSMGWTDNEIFNKIKGDHTRRKTTSLTLPQVKRDDDAADKENKPSSVDKLPEIKHSTKEKPTKETSPKECKKQCCERKKESSSSHRSRSPKKKKFVKRLPNGERVKKVVPDEQLVLTIVEPGDKTSNVAEKKPTPEATILRLTGGIELVPLLARRRRVGARTLPSSDVTRPPEQDCEWRELLNMDHLNELKDQMRYKCEQQEEKRLDSAERVRRHHATWASLWGRPGHGAPQQRGRYARNNLARLLYVHPMMPQAYAL